MRMSSLPSTKVLAAFEATARLGSMVRAGQELNVSHSAVSRNIQVFEATLGVKLFERHGSGLKLTQSGQRVYASVSELLVGFTSALEQERNCSRRNPLVISTTSSVAIGWLIPRLQSFQNLAPHVEVEIIGTRELANLDLLEIDVVLRLGSGSWAVHSLEPLCDDIVYPVCSPGFLEKHGHNLDIIDDQYLIQDLDPILDWTQWLPGRICEKVNCRAIRLHGSELSTVAAKQGLGVTLARHFSVQSDVAAGNLVRLSSRHERVSNAVWVGGSRTALHKPHVREFRRWLTQQANETVDAFKSNNAM